MEPVSDKRLIIEANGEINHNNSISAKNELAINNSNIDLSKTAFSRFKKILPPALPAIDDKQDKTLISNECILANNRDLHRTIFEAVKDSIVIMIERSPLMLFGTVAAAAISAAIPVLAQKLNSFVPELLQGGSASASIFQKAAIWAGNTFNQLTPDWFDLNTGVAAAFVLSAATGLLYAKSGLANFISTTSAKMFAPYAEQKIRLEFSKLQEKQPYEDMLGTANKDRASLIDQGLWAFNEFFNSSVRGLVSVVSLAVVSVSFFAIPGLSYVGIGLLLSTLPVAITSAYRNFENSWLTRKLTYRRREVWSGQSAISDPEIVATFRHFRATDKMRDQYQKRSTDVNESHNIISKRGIWSEGLITFQRWFTTAWAGYVALNLHAVGAPISSTLYAMGMIALFQGSLYTLAEDFSKIINLADHLNPFYKFKRDQQPDVINNGTQQVLKPEHEKLAPKIIISNLSKWFTNTDSNGIENLSKRVLDIPALTIEAGAVIGVCGEMGSGKSTFMKLVAGLYTTTTGKVTWNYQDGSSFDPAKVADDQRERITMCLQQGGFQFERLTIQELLELAHIKNSNSLISQDKAMRMTNLTAVLKSAPDGLNSRIGLGWVKGWNPSGGQSRLINIAQVVMSDCPIIIFDEPTANLDQHEKANFTDVIVPTLRRLGKTLFIVSHTFGDLAYTDKVLVFSKGEIIDSGSPQTLSQKPGMYRDGAVQEVNRALLSFGFESLYDDNGALIFKKLET